MKAVLFDLDGVITDTAKFHFLAWRELGAELGIEVDEAFNEELKGVSRIDSLERILVQGGVADQYSSAEKDAMCVKKNAHYLELIKSITSAEPLFVGGQPRSTRPAPANIRSQEESELPAPHLR